MTDETRQADQQIEPGVHQQRVNTTPTGSAPGYRVRYVQTLPPQGQVMDMVYSEADQSICVWDGQKWVCNKSFPPGACYDYVVSADGTGTHTTLFGPTGALADAFNGLAGPRCAIWVCPSHTENVTAPITGQLLSNITVESAGVSSISSQETPRFTYIGGAPAAFFYYDMSGGGYVAGSLKFKNIHFDGYADAIFAGNRPHAFNYEFDHVQFGNNFPITNLFKITDLALLGAWVGNLSVSLSYCAGRFAGAMFEVPDTNNSAPNGSGEFRMRFCSLQIDGPLYHGGGLGGFLSETRIENNTLWLTSYNKPWFQYQRGSGGDIARVGSQPITFAGIARISNNDISFDGGSYPFIKVVGDFDYPKMESLIVEENYFFVVDSSYFADISSSTPPGQFYGVEGGSIMGNTIIHSRGSGVGATAIIIGANVNQMRIDNAYINWTTPVGGVGASGTVIGGSSGAPLADRYITVGPVDPALPNNRALAVTAPVAMVDAGPQGAVTLSHRNVQELPDAHHFQLHSPTDHTKEIARSYLPFGSCGINGYAVVL